MRTMPLLGYRVAFGLMAPLALTHPALVRWLAANDFADSPGPAARRARSGPARGRAAKALRDDAIVRTGNSAPAPIRAPGAPAAQRPAASARVSAAAGIALHPLVF
jgi:hypothetical protein